MNAPQTLSRWTRAESSRVPFWAYTDAQLYQRELEKIFYGDHWCYVGLAIEIPNVGDFKLSWVGERQVIMVRDRVAPKDRGVDDGIRVVENRCAHRGVRFCQQPHGNARSFVCPYHQWTYKLNGDLAATYPQNYLDIRSFMVAQFDPNNPQQVQEAQMDLPSSSLRFDEVHLTGAGDEIVGRRIMAFITANGW